MRRWRRKRRRRGKGEEEKEMCCLLLLKTEGVKFLTGNGKATLVSPKYAVLTCEITL